MNSFRRVSEAEFQMAEFPAFGRKDRDQTVSVQLCGGNLHDIPQCGGMLVFGAGLRYRAFRRGLVRKFLKEKRIIVGLVDDDILLRGKMI